MKTIIQERIMSVVLLEEYKSVKKTNNRRNALKERTQILETASRKAQEKTLTLQETTDLYAKFNSTYEQNYGSKVKRNDDESWALKLIQESEDDAPKNTSFETRINGVPVVTQKAKIQKPSLSEIRAINQNAYIKDEPIFLEDKLKLRDSFIYDSYNGRYNSTATKFNKKPHQAFVSIMALSIAITITALIGGALFL